MSEAKIAAKYPSEQELEPGKHHWCQCGNSANQPFCDGSHKGTDFHPLSFSIAAKEKVYLCQCKHTANPPYCDGTHKNL